MCTESVALLDGGTEAGADDGSADGRIGCTPCERVRVDAMLVRVSWREV